MAQARKEGINLKLDKLYNSAWHYMRSNGRETLNLDDGVYVNLLSGIFEKVKDNDAYSDDIMSYCVDRFLAEDYKCDKLGENRVEELIKDIDETFKKNVKTHYLLIPFNGGRLQKDIFFENYYFIIGNEDEKIRKIVDLTGYDYYKIKMFIEHTKRSRSKHFMEYPMLVFKIENVHSKVFINASFLARITFMILKLMIYNAETKSNIYECISNRYENNYHVAIIGDEQWQYGHGNWWNLITVKYSLDFMDIENNQKLFLKLINAFVFSNNTDDLYFKFLNALELFEKSLEQEENYKDATLSYMLLFAAAESLLTEGKNEKKLRLSVIWPKIVTLTGHSAKDLGILIRGKYDLRNNFVHAGSLFCSEERDDLRIHHQLLAKLIMKYIDESWIKEKKDLDTWNKYVSNIFDDAVYS